MCDGGHRCPSALVSHFFASSCLTWLCLRSLSIVESTTQFFFSISPLSARKRGPCLPPSSHLRCGLRVPFSYKKWDSALPREPRMEEINIGDGHVLYEEGLRIARARVQLDSFYGVFFLMTPSLSRWCISLVEVRRCPRVVPALAEFQVCAPGQCLFCKRKIFYCT
jgi:hypothetical protein